MKKIFLLFFIIIVFIFGCTQRKIDRIEINSNKRFIVVYEQGSDFTKYFAIIEDTITEKEYLIMKMGYGAGIIELQK